MQPTSTHSVALGAMAHARGSSGMPARLLRHAIALAVFGFLALVVIAEICIRQMTPIPLSHAANTSTTVSDRNGQLLRAFTTENGRWRLALDPENANETYLNMLLAYEDKRFFDHGGVDGLALSRALFQLISNGRIVSGASTLTMQVARLLDRRHERTLRGKIHQILRAFQIERKMTKREILSLYLKLAPMGGNIEGVRAASLAYFGKEPVRLSIGESALLTALPQSPEARRPDRNRARAVRARNRVLTRMADKQVISKAEADRAKGETLRGRRYAFPKLAPHLSEWSLASAPDRRSFSLTIDRDLQMSLEKLARSHARKLGPRLSVAMLAIENETGNVRAHVGSADYFDAHRFGSIDMTRVYRSPGSALKPFIYGLAFESGLAHPETLIEDRPIRFGPYAPKNFDNVYRGTVTIRKALQTSLNIPAVKVLNAVGPSRLIGRFRKTGSDPRLPRQSAPSLAIALGGLGFRLTDIARLYVGLARGGKMIDLKYDLNAEAPTVAAANRAGKTVLDPIAAWQTTDIMRGSPPPENAKAGEIAYKTGTSYGFRDALAIGFDGRHTIAVWIGRPDSTATPGLTGRAAAAPILFDAFSRISRTRSPFPPAPDPSLIVAGNALPPPLQRFRDENAGIFIGSVKTRPLMIAFPPEGSELETIQTGGSGQAPLMLRAEGGILPLTWLVNGKPIVSTPHRRETFWQPEGRGFVDLSVIDARGKVDRTTIRLR